MPEKEIYRVDVPECERTRDAKMYDSTPLEYRVIVPDDPGGGGPCCMIYGKHRDKWEANCSARWLVRHLIEENERLREESRQAVSALNALNEAGMLPQNALSFVECAAAKIARAVLQRHVSK